jgi:hypothetical protein
MNLNQIKTAVRSGKTVHVGNAAYSVHLHVFPDGSEQWNILHSGGSCIGLTHQDGVTLNAGEGEFYVAGVPSSILGSLDTGMDVSQAVLVAVVNASGGLVSCDVEWSAHPGSREVPAGWAVHVVPLSIALRAPAMDGMLKDAALQLARLEGENLVAYARTFAALAGSSPAVVCADCGGSMADGVFIADGEKCCEGCADERRDDKRAQAAHAEHYGY